MSDTSGWYLAQGSKSVGPMTLDQLIGRLDTVSGLDTLVYGPGAPEWVAARQVAAIAGPGADVAGGGPPPPPPTGRRADVIDYEVFGDEMQYAEITLDPGETVIAEAGTMMYMTAGIKMQTVLSDPAAGQQSFLDKVVSAGKRALAGESIFLTTFTNEAAGREKIAFASPYPGKIVPMHLDELGGELICQKDAFLCAAKGVQISVAFQKKVAAGLFGGEGFVLQRLAGDGIALVHAGGTLARRELQAGEVIRLDTGCLVALMPSVGYDIQTVGGVKNGLFGGEGLFVATLTGPGQVWMQSLPFSRLAGRMLASAAQPGGKKE